MKHLLSLLLILPTMAQDKAPPSGEAKFKMNCSACHVLANVVVGPSMVTLAKSYPREKQADFLKWAKEPGKKNQNMIQMPSMAHIPDADLSEIHEYILSATKGIKNKSGKSLYPKFKEPKRALPYVVRAFMPDASPASVGVVLENGLSLCWDTEACRFRYTYVGGRTDLFHYRIIAKLPNKPFYVETADRLFSLESKPQFKGYRLVDKDPEFQYTIGSVDVRELISAGEGEGSITRTFTITGHDRPLKLDLTAEGEATLTSNKGSLEKGILSLTADEAKTFTLTITKK